MNRDQKMQEILQKKAKPVAAVDERIRTLVADMLETMYEAGGVGLAAPQVGVLKRVFVIDPTEDGMEPHVFINPEIVETSGEQFDWEGCLSVPGKQGKTTRPARVRVEYQDARGQACEVTGEGLLAVCLCHEIDHLDGKLYIDIVEGELSDATEEE